MSPPPYLSVLRSSSVADCPKCDIAHLRGAPACPGGRVGTVVAGKYHIARLLGMGGMGAVYEAVHLMLQRPVALKMLQLRMAHDPEVAARFRREAREAAALGHPGIVEVRDLGQEPDGTLYLEMELLEGEGLDVLCKRGPLPVARAVALMMQALDALAEAHARGIVHRDLKPENLFVARTPAGEQVKILDFGLAKVREDDADHGVTQSGAVMGTPVYMSPDQFRDAKRVDARADVYSMGATLYALLTGRPPVAGETVSDVLFRLAQGEVNRHPRGARPDVPEWLDAVVARALAQEPDDRFASAGEMKQALAAGGAPYAEAEALGATHPRALATSSATTTPRAAAAGDSSRAQTKPRAAAVVDAHSQTQAPSSNQAARSAAHASDPRPADAAAARAQAASASPGQADAQSQTQTPSSVESAPPTAAAGETAPNEAAPPRVTDTEPSAPPDMRGLAASGKRVGVWIGVAAVVGALVGVGIWRATATTSTGTTTPTPTITPTVTVPAAVEGMVLVPGATFLRGSRPEEVAEAYKWCRSLAGDECSRALYEREMPAKQVTVEAFHIDRNEVAGADGVPVTGVTWSEARDRCDKRGMRLPTENEWELAARGIGRNKFPWGNDLPRCEGVAFGRVKGGQCAKMGLKPAAVGSLEQDVTALGIRDLGGNVAEWTADEFEPGVHTLRGGYFDGLAESLRSAGRSRLKDGQSAVNIGFRCVRSAR